MTWWSTDELLPLISDKLINICFTTPFKVVGIKKVEWNGV